MRPLGLKAQVVAFDRELCVVDQEEIQRLLDEHGDGVKSTVSMTTNDKEHGRETRRSPGESRSAPRTRSPAGRTLSDGLYHRLRAPAP